MDGWMIATYVIGVIFSIAAVAKMRANAVQKMQGWLSTSRAAVILVYVVTFIYLLLMSQFDALNTAQGFVDLIKTTAELGSIALVTHSAGKTVTSAGT